MMVTVDLASTVCFALLVLVVLSGVAFVLGMALGEKAERERERRAAAQEGRAEWKLNPRTGKVELVYKEV